MIKDYPIGTKGIPWGITEKQVWLNKQSIKRSYRQEVLDRLLGVNADFSEHNYGNLPIDPMRYPLMAFTTKQWNNSLPCVLISGGVHGYETSGVQGAIRFLLYNTQQYQKDFNFIVAPCVSPWGYETINRWNPDALDPNRSFFADSPSPEAAQLMSFVNTFLAHKSATKQLVMHMDLHETTDTDNSEFRPALSARDGVDMPIWEIPDGFYTVADTPNPNLAFQKAIISAVSKVTHIAPADASNKIIGADIQSAGVICYDKKALFLCAGFTNASFVSTTEVYPDSEQATPENCIDAQVAAITGALDYIKAQSQ